MNSNAGGCVGGSPDQVARRIEQLFAAARTEAQVVVTEGPKMEEAIARFRDGEVDAVVVAGGDGSVAAAAKVLAGSGKPLGVLPMGTFNLFARDLQVPLELEQAVSALAGSHVRQVDTAEVNGKLFLCNSVMGLMPSLVDARESLRGKSLLQRLWDMAAAVGRLVRRYPRLTVSVDFGKGPQTITVRSLAVTCNPYDDKLGAPPTRPRLDTGRLALYQVGHRGRLGMLWLFVRLALGRWKGSTAISEWLTPQLTITARGTSIQVVNDGELLSLMLPLHYRIHPNELTVLAPAHHEPAEPAEPVEPATAHRETNPR
jgi:diacylglycerol kinase family enzyme